MSEIEIFLAVLVGLASLYGIGGGVYMLGKAHGREEMWDLLEGPPKPRWKYSHHAKALGKGAWDIEEHP